MATYAIGDVQGCFLSLKKLLKTINFDKKNDQVIFLGDLINRGPRSLETLRLVKEHEGSMTMVLGNHELFTLAISMGAIKNPKAHTLDELLAAKDAKKLLDWLKTKPIMIKQGPNVYVHAGILPAVSIDEAKLKADEISKILQSDEAEKFLRRFYEKTPKSLKPDMPPKKSLRLALAYLTLIRMCKDEKTMDNYSGPFHKAPKKLIPWYQLRDDKDAFIYFGHWAALGINRQNNCYCLDSGCVWQSKLSALRIEDQKLFQVDYCE